MFSHGCTSCHTCTQMQWYLPFWRLHYHFGYDVVVLTPVNAAHLKKLTYSYIYYTPGLRYKYPLSSFDQTTGCFFKFIVTNTVIALHLITKTNKSMVKMCQFSNSDHVPSSSHPQNSSNESTESFIILQNKKQPPQKKSSEITFEIVGLLGTG